MLKLPNLRLALAATALLTLGLGACETSKRGFPEASNPGAGGEEMADRTRQSKRQRQESDELRILDSPNRLVAAVVESKVQYKVPREVLMQRFNLQFDDGTVVDKAQIRPVQGSAKEKPTYFLVGMGLRNGLYRAMAIPLALSTDNELYLSSDAERYVIEGRGCQMCFFNFERGAIVGTTCEDNSGGCNLVVERKNNFFPAKK